MGDTRKRAMRRRHGPAEWSGATGPEPGSGADLSVPSVPGTGHGRHERVTARQTLLTRSARSGQASGSAGLAGFVTARRRLLQDADHDVIADNAQDLDGVQ